MAARPESGVRPFLLTTLRTCDRMGAWPSSSATEAPPPHCLASLSSGTGGERKERAVRRRRTKPRPWQRGRSRLANRCTWSTRDLEWELGPGVTSRHVLVVTAAGNPDLRGTARRWRRAAPPPDATWAYSDVRLPASSLTWSLHFAGHQVDAASTLVDVRIDKTRACADVLVHHPTLALMKPRDRETLCFLLLDNALGEAAVEIWLGEVTPSVTPPPSGRDLAKLQQVVRELGEAHSDDSGAPHWAILRGSGPQGKEVVALAKLPLRPMTAPHLDTHVSIDLPFDDVLPSGMPGERSLTQLRAMQHHLDVQLSGSGNAVAHETSDGTRRLHLYVDSTTPAVEQLRTAVTAGRRANRSCSSNVTRTGMPSATSPGNRTGAPPKEPRPAAPFGGASCATPRHAQVPWTGRLTTLELRMSQPEVKPVLGR